jgi:hypothetical protein
MLVCPETKLETLAETFERALRLIIGAKSNKSRGATRVRIAA